MVLVSNEWQSKSEDEHKSSANVNAAASASATATTTGTVPTPTTTTTAVAITSTILPPATATIVNTDISCGTAATDDDNTTIAPAAATAPRAGDSQNVSKTSPTIATTIKTTETASIIKAPIKQGAAIAANDNNNEQRESERERERQRQHPHPQKDKIATEIVCNNNKQHHQQQQHQKLENDNNESKEKSLSTPAAAKCNLKEDDFVTSVLNISNIKIMAENAKESPLKEEEEQTDNVASDNTTTVIISSSHCSPDKDATAAVKDNNKSNLSFVVNSNANANTLQQPSVTVKTQNTQNAETSSQQQKHIPPLRPDYIKSGLRTVIAAMKANSPTTAAAGLQPNFLTQLELTEDVAGLQTTTTFKPLCSPFNVTASAADNNHSKNDGGLLDVSADSTSLVTTTLTTNSNSNTTVPTNEIPNNGQAKILLICEGNSHPFQARTIFLTPNVECMVGRLIAKSKAAENNAIFDCKVLSRKHAVIWYTPDGKFWVKDTKSSNGTFINDNKLGDEEAELHFGDIVKFGVDVVENSRKEVHGCIIACVKLYLPDGREAISIDSPAHRSQYSGEGRISYDDLHRLNLYIQETSQREKVLASKLCSIQNILDATRKNSALCWQSMITEDQLLHRIHSLEKKLSFMEKNVPENVLRNEVLKLLDDKNSYQHTAKEALRKVYQERCDAMQMLAKMESAYTQSDNECALLRDQIMNSKQTLQDVNTRLLHLETEYNEYRDEVTRQQQETKEREEQRIVELTEKLRERERECEELKKKISELLIKRADLLDDDDDDEEQLLEKQAIEKLDAAIADMDLGEDDDDEDDDDDDDEDDEADDKKDDGVEDIDDVNAKVGDNNAECVKKRNGRAAGENSIVEAFEDNNDNVPATERDATDASGGKPSSVESKKQTNLSGKVPSTLSSIFGDSLNGTTESGEQCLADNKQQLPKTKKAKMLASLNNPNSKKTSQLKRVKESTIMKWLNNSDLKNNKGSVDIFKAICNENETENENEEEEAGHMEVNDAAGGDSSEDDDDYDAKICNDGNKEAASTDFRQKGKHFTSILKNVELNLKQLEAEIENRTTSAGDAAKASSNKQACNERETKYDDDDEKHKDVYEFDDDEDSEEICGGTTAADNDECTTARNGAERSCGSTSLGAAASYKVLSKNNKKYQLLKSSVNMLREAFNEIRDTVTEKVETTSTTYSSTSPPLSKLQQQQQQQQINNNSTAINRSNAGAHSLEETSESSRASCDDIHDLDTDSISEVESLRSLSSPVYSTQSTIKQHKAAVNTSNNPTSLIPPPVSNNLLEEQLMEYQDQVSKLNEKLLHTEMEAQHTLEIMQVECDEVKQKMLNLNHVIEVLKEDKKALEQVINENKTNASKMGQDREIQPSSSKALTTHPDHSKGVEIIEASTNCGNNVPEELDLELLENDLADINITALEREEELIMYKERLDEQQKQNIELRNEIATLKLKTTGGAGGVGVVAGSALCLGAGATKSEVLLKRILPCGFVVLAIVVYFITTYF